MAMSKNLRIFLIVDLVATVTVLAVLTYIYVL